MTTKVTIPVTFVTEANITQDNMREFLLKLLQEYEKHQILITEDCFGKPLFIAANPK
jgi:hypothetical protein